ncbi:MAG TPA: oligopeptide transporter, OPT family, partial [Candidatus Xenobia bacterium]
MQQSDALLDDREPHAEGMTAEIPGDEFVPYVPASNTSFTEMSLLVLVLGACQAILFGLADAYLGLKVGMTVGASIPAAVMSMGILRGILKRNSILENNLMQNMASVGESLAGGVVFTVPSLYLLNNWLVSSGHQAVFDTSLPKLFFIACMGGLMGILFMIPMRRYLIVKEHGRLRYPEGTACAEVLIAGDRGGDSAKTVFSGIGVAALYRLFMDSNGLNLFPENLDYGVSFLGTTLSFDMLPSLLAVGFIIGVQTCGIMTAGAALGWFVIIPLIHYFGAGLTVAIAPATALIKDMAPEDIWKFYLRYIGAGAVAFGGLVSLARALPTI